MWPRHHPPLPTTPSWCPRTPSVCTDGTIVLHQLRGVHHFPLPPKELTRHLPLCFQQGFQCLSRLPVFSWHPDFHTEAPRWCSGHRLGAHAYTILVTPQTSSWKTMVPDTTAKFSPTWKFASMLGNIFPTLGKIFTYLGNFSQHLGKFFPYLEISSQHLGKFSRAWKNFPSTWEIFLHTWEIFGSKNTYVTPWRPLPPERGEG